MKRWIFLIVLSVVCAFFSIGYFLNKQHTKVLKIITFDNYLHEELLQQFREQKGIEIQVDIIDSGESLDTKLTMSGQYYDIIILPHDLLARYIVYGVLLPLEKDLIPNRLHISAKVLEALGIYDVDNNYVLPYAIGSTGFLIDVDAVSSIVPEDYLNSWKLIFDKRYIETLTKKCKVFVLDSADELFFGVGLYLGKLEQLSLKDLEEVADLIRSVHDFIEFKSSGATNAVLSGDACVAMTWSGDALQVQQVAEKLGKNLQFFIPKEGAETWVDVIGVSARSKNPEVAMEFINFVHEPARSAQLMQHIRFDTGNISARKYLSDDFLNNDIIFPGIPFYLPLMNNSVDYLRKRTRLWLELKMGQ